MDYDEDDDDRFVWGVCEMCEGPLTSRRECLTCTPRIALEDTPVLASFSIVEGVVSWAGWCTEEIGLLLEEHIP